MRINRIIAIANRLARELKNANCPTTGHTPAEFWRILSGDFLPVYIAKKLYLKAGYKPFSGYPLIHK